MRVPCSDVDNVSHFVSGSLVLCFLKILSIALIRKNVTLGRDVGHGVGGRGWGEEEGEMREKKMEGMRRGRACKIGQHYRHTDRWILASAKVVGSGECCLDGLFSTITMGVDALTADPLRGEGRG